jgi:hypothetical protein
VKKLQSLDKSFTVIPDPKKVPLSKKCKFYVSSVPIELDLGFQEVLSAAQAKGHVSVDEVASLPNWSKERAKQALRSMVQDGMCLIDKGDRAGVVLYWFPVLSTQLDL